jgi:outer membrane protein assembly factor BamB
MLHTLFRRGAVTGALIGATIAGGSAASWPEWRGPGRDGRSSETSLPDRWSPAGENLAWKAPYGSRSAPVVFGNRVYINTVVGDLGHTQERLAAIDAESGKLVWEQRFSQYLSDVPQHRAAWASPAVDPATGNVYVFTVSAELVCVSQEGKVLWSRSLTEDFGAVTTHGGRTTSPIVEGDLVILNTLILAWGDLNRPGNRYFAFDKASGRVVWVSSPQARHYDTNYSTPIVVDLPAGRSLIVGGTDGVFHALRLNTGEKVWSVEVSKRAILNSALFRDNIAYITHGEENMDTTEMGMVAAVDASKSGVLGADAFKWRMHGFLPTFASPVMDAERLYTVDNGAIVGAFELKTGRQLWTRTLGTLQKGSPVLADGKLYIGTENGKVFILRPTATGVDVLDEDLLGTAAEPEPIVASPAVADGRVYIASMENLYAIGKRTPRTSAPPALAPPARTAPSAPSAPSSLQLFPYDVMLAPGQPQAYRVRLFDARGVLVREEPASAATWAVEQVRGTMDAKGVFTAGQGNSAGFLKATVGGVTGQARVRVIAPLPWSYDFEEAADENPPGWWAGAPTKLFQRNVEGLGKVLVRPRDETVGRRAKVLMGPADWSNYTVEVDVRGREQRRQRGDAGVINQRYALVLFGNGQKLELHPWQAADEMTVRIPFKWDVDTWYRLRLRVDNQSDGTVLVRGKVWKTGDSEPAAWTIEKKDTIPHRSGSPGLYGDGISEMYFDNLRVYKNQ